jgi:GNAT superfamily N-acetyltransferase
MCIEDIKNNYYIEKLSSNHCLNSFSCGLKDMDDFLKNDALNQQIDNLNVTYFAMYDDEIVGFFSLLEDIIQLKDIENEYDLPYSTCPAIKIGRFAVNEKYNSLGLGTVLLDNVCYQIKRISEIHGVRFITVDAYCNVRGFYYKNEFNHLKIHDKKKLIRKAERNPYLTIPLYKDLKRI